MCPQDGDVDSLRSALKVMMQNFDLFLQISHNGQNYSEFHYLLLNTILKHILFFKILDITTVVLSISSPTIRGRFFQCVEINFL